ncbi:MAG: alginate lyase family protein, partial [Lacunisphaera sp.]|nr:alginate lyase family protein [Lacunisphaera sp.]
PHLEYAQVRLGHNGNRGNAAGMLDARDFASVIDALRLLEGSPALTPDEAKEVRHWFTAYLQWFTTAKIALQERAAKNNHGTWYFAQAIPIARYVGRDDLARQLVREDQALLARQLKPDGSQPEEIRRVDGLGYSVFNLEAHARVARHAAGLGLDLWNYTAPNGAGLRAALEFLRPYNHAPEQWPTSQKEKLRPGFLDALLREAAQPPVPAATP